MDNEDHRKSRSDDQGQAMGRAEGQTSKWKNANSEYQRDPERAAIPTIPTGSRRGAIHVLIFPCSSYLAWILWGCKSESHGLASKEGQEGRDGHRRRYNPQRVDHQDAILLWKWLVPYRH